MANQLGKRYQCEVCGAIVLCTKAGTGAVQCHDKPMAELQAKRLPSSD
ncbi:MAG: desulfoferrodoxin [Chloroflexota bacterium]|nr:desulfoferrodoxin [Chloroflexota bacterium]